MKIRMQQSVKVIVEHDLSKTVLELLKNDGLNKPFIVLDKFLLGVPAVKEMLGSLEENGIEYKTYAEIVPDPPARIINDGAKEMKDFGADSVIAIGGGSSLDSAKGINIVASDGGKIEDYVKNESAIHDLKTLISIPTTAGTGSEMSNALVVTDEATEEKDAILSDKMLSDYALLIPELTISLPKRQTIASGLDAFSHAAEGYLSTLSSPVADAIAEKIMFLGYNYLPGAVKDGNNLEMRQRVMVAACLAGWILNQSGTIVAHSEAHILGSKYHFVHGEAVAYALPAVLKLVAPVEPKKVKEIGKILGAKFSGNETPEEIAETTVKAYKHFRDEMVGLHPFSDYGISNQELEKNAEEVVNERFAGNTPVKLTKENVSELLKNFG
ncbi:iron-containing alcohol dehydrogenase [Limosilactobacillus sp. RRLNB_1_1]|uniref:Iron-containing alcohol dehydrogenase n=1 Tax=Limosilactobacillus albertensis TaxID=2759752 RepID=A0A7W3Y8Q4_9LACO|nr:iron-containing alcohol dehydrogenase [Limosilactobacillus albertensis]MBB1069717.1 iron-containing alcohol dehydrogenase [Limosilactobacillus albertensis]MCD7117821.1 iron-containing alcohol dehydrogenase [Limosilactobacillus albertensis]MCD7128469.1 iron-containing alcohol dehydrogenase [Limosilactobacillus albertensis]